MYGYTIIYLKYIIMNFNRSIPVFVPVANMLFQITDSVPVGVLLTLSAVQDLEIDDKCKCIGDPDQNSALLYVINTPSTLDVFLSYAIQDYNIANICEIILACSPQMHLSKSICAIKLAQHVQIANEMYIWGELEKKIEYSYYQLNKRMWPVKKQSNIDWQTMANKLGIVDKVYPNEAKMNKPVKKFDELNKLDKAEKKAGESDDESDDECVINHAVENKKVNDSDTNIECDSDSDDELVPLVDDKIRHAKRAEKMLALTMNSNYTVYGIPDILQFEITSGLNMLSVVKIYDALIAIAQEKTAVMFLCHLMVSRKFFHLVVKNAEMLKRIKICMKKHIRVHPLIKYVMNYSFYMMGKEERLHGKNIAKDNRSIMTAEQFRELPIFGGCLEDSPYFSEVFNAKYPLMKSLPLYVQGPRKFVSHDEFITRLNTTSGNMLKNINLSQHSAILTGSSISPCIVTNPLEDNFDNFASYVEHYYPSYTSIDELLKKYETEKQKLWEAITKLFSHNPAGIDNIKKVYNEDDEFILSLVKIELPAGNDELKESRTSLMQLFEEVIYMESKLSDLDVAIIADTREQYDEHVQQLFKEIKNQIILDQGDTYETRVYLFKQPLKYGFKWVLKGPGAKRPIDFFHVGCAPHTLVNRFHLNIVRFWWDGVQLKGFASAVCAGLTGVNQWYKWFSTNKNPMDIVLKNVQRGYTTLLNMREIGILTQYIEQVDKYKYLASIFDCGLVSTQHEVFDKCGGIWYYFSNNIKKYKKHINSALYYPMHSNVLIKRIGCELNNIKHGGLIAMPKVYAFDYIIDDLLD
jgi:hypothetical protein